MMRVGAKRALGLYRSCAPRQWAVRNVRHGGELNVSQKPPDTFEVLSSFVFLDTTGVCLEGVHTRNSRAESRSFCLRRTSEPTSAPTACSVGTSTSVIPVANNTP